MEQVKAFPKNREELLQAVAGAISAASPQWGSLIAPDSIGEGTRLECHWMFRVAKETVCELPFGMKSRDGKFVWTSGDTLKSFLDQIEIPKS